MENLKQIVSENSNNWKEISLEEIQALDKKELVKSLKEISPDLEQDLKNGLKNLISNNIQSVNNLGETSSNNQIIIYAMQIYANLCWMKMPIDGVFNKDLVSPDFKKLFTKKQTNLSEKLGLPVEKLKDAKNLSEFLDTTLETLIKKMLGKLNSPEWIPLKTWEIYKELVILLQEIDKNLPVWNIYKWNSKLIIDNFLTPKENAEKLINSVIDKVLNPNEKETKSQDIDSLKIAIKWWLWSLIDVAKNQDEVKLKSYINEFKNIPKIKEYIEKVPEFDKIFDLFISLLKTLDKNELFYLIDNFFEKNTSNLLKLANKKPWEKLDDKVKLEVVNSAWKIVDNLITKERVDIIFTKMDNFDFIKKSPIMKQAVEILNNEKLTPDNKNELLKEISKLILAATNPEINDSYENQQNVKIALNSIINLLSKFNKEWKINEQLTIDFIKKLLIEFKKNNYNEFLNIKKELKVSYDKGKIEGENISKLNKISSDIDKNFQLYLSKSIDAKDSQYKEKIIQSLKWLNEIVQQDSQISKESKIKIETSIKNFIDKLNSDIINNSTSFLQLLKDNIWILLDWISWYFKWNGYEDGLEKAIKSFIRTNKLSDNISKAWGNLIERLEKSFQLNTADIVLSMRNTILESQVGVKNQNGEKTDKQQAAIDIWNIMVDKISKKGFELIKEKLSSQNESKKQLTKEDIINTIFSWIWDIFQDPELKDKIFDNAKKLWAKIDNKEQFIQNLITNFLNNPEFKSIINNISTILLQRLANSKNISLELDNIKNDINKLASDFTKNYKKDWINWAIKTFNETKIIDEKTKQEVIWTSISIIYDYVGKKENISSLLKSFPEISKNLPKWISEDKMLEIMQKFVKAIPKNVVWEILQKEISSGTNVENLKTPEKVLELVNKLISHKDVNKDLLLQTIIQADLWKVINSQTSKNEKVNISKETISSWVDSLYTLLSQTSKEDINALVSSLWLDKIFSGAIDTTLKNIPKETLKRNLLANVDFVNNAANWDIDMNKWLKFVWELYRDIPVEKRLLVVDDLVTSIDFSSWWWENLNINSSNSKYISDIVYATLETNDTTKLSSIIWKINPGLQEILSQKKFLGKDNLSLWVWVLKSIPKEKFENFLNKNSGDLNSLMNSKNEDLAIKIGVELFKEVNTDKLGENLKKDTKLSKNENTLIDMSDSVQKSLSKNQLKLNEIKVTLDKLEKFLSSQEKDFSKSSISKQELENFSSNSFDLINDTLMFETQKIMQKEWLTNISDARVKLAEKFEIPSWKSWNLSIDTSKIFWEFLKNNFWFLAYWGWAYVFKWQDYTFKNAWMDYFLDKNKKQDFVNITLGYFDLKG